MLKIKTFEKQKNLKNKNVQKIKMFSKTSLKKSINKNCPKN